MEKVWHKRESKSSPPPNNVFVAEGVYPKRPKTAGSRSGCRKETDRTGLDGSSVRVKQVRIGVVGRLCPSRRDAARRVFGNGVVENYLLVGGAKW